MSTPAASAPGENEPAAIEPAAIEPNAREFRAIEPSPVTRREGWLAALAFALLALALLAEPIAKLGTHAYSTGDLANLFALLDQQEKHVPANRLVSDPAFQMQPWTRFIAEELHAGRLPLWNPYSGCGEPLVANYQSALFSPFQWPFYVLPFEVGLVASAFLKLFALGLFTWLFLRRIGLAALSAGVGAVAFAFSGHNVLLLGYPHPGALVVLPAGLWCAERVLQASERGARVLRPAVALAFAVGIGALSGHPEPFFFGVAAIALWCAWRANHVRRARSWRAALLALGAIALAGVAGVALAAPQILPFLEYLQHASALTSRVHNQQPFEWRYLPLWMFPMLFGNPASPYLIDVRIPSPNYEGANMSYAGALVLVAALAACAGWRRDPRVRFAAVLAVLWFLYAYDVAGIGRAAAHVPLLGRMPINRSQPLWLFVVALLAALGADRELRRAAPDGRGRALLAVGIGAALWLAALAGAEREFAAIGERVRPATQMSAVLPAHVREITLSLAAGVAALAVLAWASSRAVRGAACAFAALVVFHQTGWIHRDYNPTIEQRFLFPRTALFDELKATVGDENLAALGEAPLAAELNVAYRLALLCNYDAMGVASFDKFLHQSFAAFGSNKDPRSATTNALAASGTRWILARGSWPAVDSALGDQIFKTGLRAQPVSLEAGVEVVQQFDVARDGMRALLVWAGAFPGARDRVIALRLEHAERGLVFSTELAIGERLAKSRDPEELPASFEYPAGVAACAHPVELPEGLPRGRYRLRLSCADGAPQQCPVLWKAAELKVSGSAFAVRGALDPAALYFDWSFALPRLQFVRAFKHLWLYRDREGLGRYFTVGASEVVASQNDALRRLLDPSFDARRTVLLEGVGGASTASGEPAQAVRIVEELPARVSLEAERASDGWLVICRARYPGWRARVDGAPAELLPANGAFSALRLAAGKHRVELEYAPSSWTAGCAIGAAALVALLVAAWRARS
ncbi:MAG: hypothetical protein EPO68_14600 [Planctomycetota bacterium]|nr:MAG: hypothetical protein EPO68_14600 [Planctomycetota bacterium]